MPAPPRSTRAASPGLRGRPHQRFHGRRLRAGFRSGRLFDRSPARRDPGDPDRPDRGGARLWHVAGPAVQARHPAGHAAFRLPGLSNLWLNATKDTALVAVVGYSELALATRRRRAARRSISLFFLVAGAIYLAISLGFAAGCFGRLETHVRRGQPKLRLGSTHGLVLAAQIPSAALTGFWLHASALWSSPASSACCSPFRSGWFR